MAPAALRMLVTAIPLGSAVVPVAPIAAQTAPAPPRDDKQVTVTGRRLPAAEAPRYATCEALARDPFVQAQIKAAGGDPFMGPRFFLPTRMPRNPDYSAPPSAPVGSPLPALGKARFGATSRTIAENGADTADVAATEVLSTDTTATAPTTQNSLDAAILACRAAYARGSNYSVLPASDNGRQGVRSIMPGIDQRAQAGRAFIAANDTTLPTAFALFDQGRYGESLDWFRKAETKLPDGDGGDEAALFIGKITLQALGDKSDPVEAVKWLKKAATATFNPVNETPIFDPRAPELNTAIGEAAVILGNLYRTGFRTIPKDPEASRKYYARALAVGHIPAAKMLGDIYYDGIDTPRDVAKAASYYEQAAKLNLPAAQVALADILHHGEDGVKADPKTALGWYQAAAKFDHPAALYALGRAYDLGDGVAADQQLALGFYKSAALHGDVAARVALGTYFYEGKLVPKDDATARRWFAEAASKDDPDGMVNLAAMMARGEGGAKDMPHAWVWLRRAASLGNARAPQTLAALERRMSPAEREAATSLLTSRPIGG